MKKGCREWVVSELLRGAELCFRSGSSEVRAVGVLQVMRATGVANGEIDPELLSNADVARIIRLMPRSPEENHLIGRQQR